ncbi:putative LLM family oxidoreductase [Leifsonia sp. AK011]|uniref:LLM class flavin-dependent oxidoreductase n=1 Tax=Leifsonia sp. AK011 TaxID=2723075 RepID=UPI0015CBD0B2|nr:LLM class flavin-dependent oxidoreductase [Leifsonia sp. AK011]NYF09222.1 putative LLM family oxidoreductase [Leifsonia sp. AK011]
MSTQHIEFGLNSFGELIGDGTGRTGSPADSVRAIVEEAVLAEKVGIDIFSIGEHYRPEMVDSANHVILGTIAGRTESIRLGTSVTVLSTNDPVRIYAEAATLQALSHGRAQLVVGRASATESFPLFGYDLADYETLFEEKLDLLAQLMRNQPVTWSGSTRSSLTNQSVQPAIEPDSIPVWVGVGGSPQSVIRAARYRMPLMLAIVGGNPSRFAPFVDLYHRALQELGHAPLPIAEHSLGFFAATDEEARDTYWPLWKARMTDISRERGFRAPTPENFYAETQGGALFVGSPETMANRIASTIRTLGLSRFDLKYDVVDMPPELRFQSIELFGREVIPRVRELLAKDEEAAGGTDH